MFIQSLRHTLKPDEYESMCGVKKRRGDGKNVATRRKSTQEDKVGATKRTVVTNVHRDETKK